MVVHDFAYADICFDGYEAPSILQVPGAKDVAVEIFSMSKSYNMAGWRVGFCLGNQKMIARSGANQELSGLRRVSADSDCFNHRAAGVRRRYRQDLQALREAPQSAGRWT